MRALAALSLALAAAIFAFAAITGGTGSQPVGFAAAIVAAALTAWLVWTRPLLPLDPAATSRGLAIVSGVATVAALVQLARLTVFMVSASQPAYSMVPSSPWEVRHSCLTAYFVAAQAAGEGHDIFDDALYTLPGDDPSAIRKARMIGPFGIDVYEYPPPFLLLPRACRLVTTDFFRMRALWFGLNGAVVLLALLVVARSMGPVVGTRAVLLSPLVLAGMSTLGTLQKGNVQLVIIALSMLAMTLFERRRDAAGGALLAYAGASKLYPGMLVVYLLARKQWRAVAWTAAMGVVCVALTLADIGWAPFATFLAHLSGILGGEAFPAFRNPAALAINLSVPGLVFKLKLFGVPGMGFAASKVVGWIYTLVVLWVAVRVAQRTPRDGEQPLVWLAILLLATLRSPFLPQAYGTFPGLWLLTLLAASRAPTARTLTATVLGWAALGLVFPVDWPIDPRLLALLTLLTQAALAAAAVLALRRRDAAPA